jgi:ATP-dependent DNA helicase PIF1
VLAVASSGISALLIPEGHTVHSMFKIFMNAVPGESVCNVPKNSRLADLFQQTTLIIWDEAAAQHRADLEAFDKTLHDICGVNLPFGCLVLLCGGDFKQTLPVITSSNPADTINATIQCLYLWPSFQVLHLFENK